MRPHEDGNYSLEEQHGAMADAIEWPPEAREAVARAICVALGDDPDREGKRLLAYDPASDAALAALAPFVAEIKAAAFQRGAEAMRLVSKRAALDVLIPDDASAAEGHGRAMASFEAAMLIANLPIPEDKQP